MRIEPGACRSCAVGGVGEDLETVRLVLHAPNSPIDPAAEAATAPVHPSGADGPAWVKSLRTPHVSEGKVRSTDVAETAVLATTRDRSLGADSVLAAQDRDRPDLVHEAADLFDPR